MYTNRISFPVSPRHEPELIRDLERLLFYTRETPDGTLWGVGGKPSGDGEYKQAPAGDKPDLVCRYTKADHRLVIEANPEDQDGTRDSAGLLLLLRNALLPYAGQDRFAVPSFQPVRMAESVRMALYRAVRTRNPPAMPVVALSLMPDGSMLWDPGKLAGLLGGIAHVITPVTKKEQDALNQTFPDYPERGYGGGFLFGKKILTFPLYDDPEDAGNAVRHILHDMRSCIPELVLPDGVSWKREAAEIEERAPEERSMPDTDRGTDHLAAELADAEEALRAKDAEIAELKASLMRAEEARQKAEARCFGLQKKLDAGDARPILVTGKETDLYDGEIRETVLEILQEAKTSCRERSRKLDVLTDLLDANPMTGIRQKMRDDLKQEIKKADSTEDALRVFARYGYHEESHHGHIKLGYKDPRYSSMMAASPSDPMGYRHTAQIITRMLLM